MDYIFGADDSRECLKTVGAVHSDLEGYVEIRREYDDAVITDRLRIVRRTDSTEDSEGRCYDWYDIDSHYRLIDKTGPIASELAKRTGQLAVLAGKTDDATAAQMADLFPALDQSGKLVKAGTRIRWTDGKLYACAVDTWDREDTDPAHNPNGWTVLAYHSGYRDIPDVLTTTTLFHKGEIGWRADKFWQSTIDNNVWTPEAYPAGWTEAQT